MHKKWLTYLHGPKIRQWSNHSLAYALSVHHRWYLHPVSMRSHRCHRLICLCRRRAFCVSNRPYCLCWIVSGLYAIRFLYDSEAHFVTILDGIGGDVECDEMGSGYMACTMKKKSKFNKNILVSHFFAHSGRNPIINLICKWANCASCGRMTIGTQTNIRNHFNNKWSTNQHNSITTNQHNFSRKWSIYIDWRIWIKIYFVSFNESKAVNDNNTITVLCCNCAQYSTESVSQASGQLFM